GRDAHLPDCASAVDDGRPGAASHSPLSLTGTQPPRQKSRERASAHEAPMPARVAFRNTERLLLRVTAGGRPRLPPLRWFAPRSASVERKRSALCAAPGIAFALSGSVFCVFFSGCK